MQRWMAGILGLLVACGAPEADSASDSPPARAADPAPLAASLAVRVAGDSVVLRLDLTNTTGAPVVLEFASGQRYDFAISDSAGGGVWRWSADRSFAQVLGTDTVAAGGTRSYEEAWPAGGRTGRFVADAQLSSSSNPVALRTEFELPGG